jgi:TetR/AcrR family transcriptional regulator, transcriptional repressor for nem operon
MNKSERTRQYIIEKTAPVFNMRGFEGTTLSILQEVTGLTKGSLYGNFSDKEEIAREAFLYSMVKVREFVAAKLISQKSAKGKLTALAKFYADYVFDPPIQGGCPLLNHAVEADDHHVSLRKTVSDEISRTISVIASLLDEGKKNGEFRKDISSKDLANVFFASIEGAIMVSRVSQSDASMKAVVKHCKSILDSISIK